MAQIDQLMLSDHFYEIERRTYDLLQAEIGPRSRTPSSADLPDNSIKILPSLYTACCLTVIVYVALALREVPAGAGMFYTLIERLTTVVQGIDIVQACALYPNISLWVLGTGGAGARGRKKRGWYVKQLADFCHDRNIYDWDAMNEVFSSPMHLVLIYKRELMDVWNEVEELRITRELV
jgi:hypothetical protein